MNKILSKTISKAVIFFGLFSVLLPVAILIIWSFADNWPWPALLPSVFSFRAFHELLGGYSGALEVLFSSILISVAVAAISLLISIPAARAVALYDFYGKNLLKFVILLPVIVPVTAFAMGIQVFFIRWGLSDTVWGVIIVQIILCLPYTLKILTEVTEAAGNKLESQARVLGASPFQTFRYITLPLMIPGIIAAGSMAYIVSFSQYFLTFLIGGGNVITISMLMFPYIQSGDRGIFRSRLGECKVQLEDGRYKAMLRPTSFKIMPGNGDFQVHSVSFLGDRYNVMAANQEVNFLITIGTDNLLEVGDQIGIEIDFAKSVFFRNED